MQALTQLITHVECKSALQEPPDCQGLINDAYDELEKIKISFSQIANMAHLAWLDPTTVKPIFERIEQIAKNAIGD